MAVCHDNVLDEILFLGSHGGYPLAAAALRLIGVGRQALYVALVGYGDRTAHAVYQILDKDLVFHFFYGGAALVAVFSFMRRRSSLIIAVILLSSARMPFSSSISA